MKKNQTTEPTSDEMQSQYSETGELARQPESLLEFFRSVSRGTCLHLTRNRDTTRPIKW